jgi:hypothetical protein
VWEVVVLGGLVNVCGLFNLLPVWRSDGEYLLGWAWRVRQAWVGEWVAGDGVRIVHAACLSPRAAGRWVEAGVDFMEGSVDRVEVCWAVCTAVGDEWARADGFAA